VSDPDFAELAAATLKRRASEARLREFSRDQGIGVVANAMAERRRRRRALRGFLVGSVLASAAGIALYLGVGSLRTETHTVCVGPGCGVGHIRVDGAVSEHRLEHGQSVVAGQGRATVVEFGTGTKITLKDQGELVYREDTAVQRFGLVRGAAHLVVAKLSNGQRFVVDTEDAEVEVRGTVFDVAVKVGPPECPRRTAVAVTEGAVEVRSRGKKLVLRPGDTWEGECAPAARVADAARAPARVAKKAPVAPAPLSSTEVVASVAEPQQSAKDDAAESSLNEQNDLYAAATAARKQGDGARALALYDRLLERFPRGPLAESASVERIRLLKRLSPERAEADARRHLSRYPQGFASVELKALLSPP
jgi:ferric-dicitrate binding protein FerR (iron transport regulator)